MQMLYELPRSRWFGAPGVVIGLCLLASSPGLLRAQSEGESRQFAPGVLTTIPPQLDPVDAIHIRDMVEIRANEQLQWDPKTIPQSRTLYAMAEDVAFVHDLWCLEFSFKPMRMIEVDVPQESGGTQRKLIWYLVYRVRNIGAGIAGEIGPDGAFITHDQPTKEIRFFPEFVLASQDRDADDKRSDKEYLDRIVPSAMEQIIRRERISGDVLNSVEMPQHPLPIEQGRLQRGVWGVAIWEDVDPTIDFFSVFVGGLTNAHRWEDSAGAFAAGDPPGKGRTLEQKKLQLNFWRPGDQYDESEREIRFGVPEKKASLYDSREGVAYRWVFR